MFWSFVSNRTGEDVWSNNLIPVVGLRSRFRRFDAFEAFEEMNERCAGETDVQTVVAVVTSAETQQTFVLT